MLKSSVALESSSYENSTDLSTVIPTSGEALPARGVTNETLSEASAVPMQE